MSATLNFYRRMHILAGNDTLMDFGSQVAPKKAATIDGEPMAEPKTVILAPGGVYVAWDYTVDGEFAIFMAECDSFAWVEQHVDAPVDAAAEPPDYTAAGTHINNPKEGLSCNAPLPIQGMAVPVVPTAGGHQDNYSNTSFHASTVNGRRYKITFKNPADAEASVKITFAWSK